MSLKRPADFHFQDVPQYEARERPHSMFESMEDAAGAIARGLNCRAGEAALRFLSVTAVNWVAIYSGQVAITTAYPAHQLTNRQAPPEGADLVLLCYKRTI